MHPDLSLEQAPPISVPFRFFLTAPAFGAGAGILILLVGAPALASRWAPATLALTHLLTLGYISLVMCGALMQMMPVLAGVVIPRPVAVSGVVHAALSSGTVLLGAGFVWWSPAMLTIAAVLLAGGFAVFVAAAVWSLARARASGASVNAMRGAVFALVVAVSFGVLLVLALSLERPGRGLAALTNAHAAWGLLGWVGLLVSGVAYQVVPMFQITARYPAWLTRWLSLVIFAALSVWTITYLGGGILGADIGPSVMASASIAVCLAALAVFAIATLRLQFGRKRRTEDATRSFWYVGMASVLLSAAIWLALAATPAGTLPERYVLLLGAVVLVGFATSVIAAMLYKIVPFLAWLHLQQQMSEAGRPNGLTIPNVRRIIPAANIRRQFRLHLAACLALVAAVMWPAWFARPAGAMLTASFVMLGYNLFLATASYRRHRRLLRDASGAAAGGAS